jgi:hypothetical protein
MAKERKRVKAAMDQRTRARLPVLPALARTADHERKATRARLDAALSAAPGQVVDVHGEKLQRRNAGETVYTYRANTGTDPLQHHAGEREVARGATMADAIQALLSAAAEPYTPSVQPQSATTRPSVTGEGDAPEPFTVDGQPACGEPVDGGRCGRAPGHEGHPHIVEPSTRRTGEYYVMRPGFTAPANRPPARFAYTFRDAGDAFDRALAWARQYAQHVNGSYDLWHTDSEGSAFIAQVTADGRLLWPRH